MASRKNTSRTIGAVNTTCKIIEEIRKRNGAGVTELADALDVSKSTIHHHLATLEDQNFLRKSKQEYRIGLRFLLYGGHAREEEDTYSTWKEDVDQLADETGNVARLIVENSRYGQTLYQEIGEQIESYPTQVGMMEHLHCTAAGKAFLAALPDADTNMIIDEHGLPEMTENTITNRSELKAELETIRSKGISFDDEEQFQGIRCVASTLTNDKSDLLGAVSVSAPVEQMPENQFREEIPRIINSVVDTVEPIDDYRFRHSVPCIGRTLPE